jgi:histidine triad (HIT) family protein
VKDCLFCSIADGGVDADIVSSTSEVVAFRDINPQSPTHVLVVPRRHIDSVAALAAADRDVLADIFDVIASLARDEGLDEGYRVVTNVGPDAGQSVPHLHFHLMGGRRFSWPPG